MTTMRNTGLALVTMLLAVGCVAPDGSSPWGDDALDGLGGKDDSSVEAVFVDFEFDGELVTSSSWGLEQRIEDQLLYTIGHLNGDRSVGRLDAVQLSAIRTESVEDGIRVTYHARLPVAWGRRSNVPTEYTLRLPRVATYQGFQQFTERYMDSCVDWGAHDVDSGSMWYYYRPNRSGCSLDEADIVTLTATVTPSEVATTGMYPEYHKIWEDDVLRVVAIFGKYEDGATSGDAGISAYNSFVSRIGNALRPYSLVTTPEEFPSSPGVEVPDITFSATLEDGRTVEVVALLVDNVRTAGQAFDRRYEELSQRADLIAYNGHSGLGANIRALARKGRWVQGQYVIVFMNGCDTYTYIDSSLAEAHMDVNPDDLQGTRYLDIVTNAMPAYFASDAAATMALVDGLMSYDDPQTFEDIFDNVDSSQVVLVTGEQDNVYRPGGGGGSWPGFEEMGTVERGEEARFETPLLEAGRYVFEMGGTDDADLYVRVGAAPDQQHYDCRPYTGSSNESCTIDLATPSVIHVMVRGYATASEFRLRAFQEGGGEPPPAWDGMEESGTVARDEEARFETTPLPRGRYVFEMTGTSDADLYVRVGQAPTAREYDCRPYRSDSNERCVVTLGAESVVHVMVRGYASSSDYVLIGQTE